MFESEWRCYVAGHYAEKYIAFLILILLILKILLNIINTFNIKDQFKVFSPEIFFLPLPYLITNLNVKKKKKIVKQDVGYFVLTK